MTEVLVIDREPLRRNKWEHRNTVATIRRSNERYPGDYLVRVRRGEDDGWPYIEVIQNNYLFPGDTDVLCEALRLAKQVAVEDGAHDPDGYDPDTGEWTRKSA